MIALGCNPEDPRFQYPELKDTDLYTKNVDQPYNLGDRLRVGFGGKASMETRPKQRMLNTHWIVSSIVS